MKKRRRISSLRDSRGVQNTCKTDLTKLNHVWLVFQPVQFGVRAILRLPTFFSWWVGFQTPNQPRVVSSS